MAAMRIEGNKFGDVHNTIEMIKMIMMTLIVDDMG